MPKNVPANLHCFSSFQLVFVQNPKLPSTFAKKLPSLISHNTSATLTDNLTALHKARQAFISSESSYKIRRALNNNARTKGDT